MFLSVRALDGLVELLASCRLDDVADVRAVVAVGQFRKMGCVNITREFIKTCDNFSYQK